MDLKYSKIVAQETNRVEMLFYGLLGEEIDGGMFARELDWLCKNYQEVCIRVNSNGGCVTDGFGILATMMASPARIVVQVDGVAASIAALFVAGADEVTINDFGLIMIHSPYYQDDNDERIQNLSPKDQIVLTNLKNSMVQLLTKRGIPEATVRKMMIEDTWFNADQALAAKLVDRIITTGRKVEMASLDPKRLVAALQNEHTKIDIADMKKVIAALKLPETADESTVVAAVEKLQASDTKIGLVVDKLIAVGKTLGTITDATEPSMKKLAGTDLNLFLDLFQVNAPEKAPVAGVDPKDQIRLSEVVAKLAAAGGAPVAKVGKDLFAEMEKKGPQALAAWKQEKPAEYSAAFKEYWGEDAK